MGMQSWHRKCTTFSAAPGGDSLEEPGAPVSLETQLAPPFFSSKQTTQRPVMPICLREHLQVNMVNFKK
jgi:hypothetical protein